MDLNKIFDSVSSIDGVELNPETNIIAVPSASLLAVADKFKNNINLEFDFLMCITALDNGDSKNFTIAYNFHSNRSSRDKSITIPLLC